ncbi:Thylakoid lumenal 15.0 kDa protein 2, chloroplastic [Triticum urartu]|uniref:Thylakoid lumenal 15.0 kDa protein 2, chloroplastic n=1 Tax=Triticum urartu TaxID=4572 RepID=M8ACM2_TRIUA|nr:Thylakoid lumenal 15.0 kDa protein 2, chloroplastic [Triticum urartu]
MALWMKMMLLLSWCWQRVPPVKTTREGVIHSAPETRIVAAVGRIRELREVVRVLTGDLVGDAQQVQELNATRGNLVALQEKLTIILYVSQALAALKLLVLAADCAGALDVIDDLQNLIDTDELAGLYCFRHIRDQLGTSLDSVNSILSAEFVRAAVPDGKTVDAMVLSTVKRKTSTPLNGTEHEVNVDEEDGFILRDRLLPLIICLLRTKTKFSIFFERSITYELKKLSGGRIMLIYFWIFGIFTGGQSLANKLRSLSSEGFVQLLSAIFSIVQVHLQQAAEVKKIVQWIMRNLDGNISPDDTNPVVQHGGSVDLSQEKDYDVTSRVSNTVTRTPTKLPLFQGKTNDMSSINSIKNIRADVLRESTEAVFAACDAAHGRWAKLLGVRAALHPKLRLQEFLIIYNITEEFIAATEKVGGRLGYNIRGILQQQSKQFVEYQHSVRMAKIKAVLDQETWIAVDVPEEFQAIVLSLSSTDFPVNGMEMPSNDNNSKLSEDGVSTSQESAHSTENNVENSNGTSTTSNENKVESTSQTENSVAGHVRPVSQTIVLGGVGYHMVNCGLILLKMLSEYVDISKCLPSLSFEVVQRVVEILKHFNTRTCQLVLGAGAMQVSGLKSITSKHLALASQIISFIHSLIPDIRRVLFLKIPEVRKHLLMSELDRVTQDYKVHRDEIHTKLVQIMRERLLANLRKLPQIVESWNGPDDNDSQPSLFAKAVTKEVTYLHRILSQILLEVDLQAIFRQVVQIFHSHITEAFSKLEVSSPQAKNSGGTYGKCEVMKDTTVGIKSYAVVGLANAKAGVNKPELLPKEFTTVIDVAGFLSSGQENRLRQEIEDLEKDTGYKLRVLAQNYPDTPGLAIKDFWQVDDRTIVFVADPTFGNIINFNIGSLIDLDIPQSFWSRVAGKYGNMFYWKEKGEDASIEGAVMAISRCLREPTGASNCSEFGLAIDHYSLPHVGLTMSSLVKTFAQ